MTLRHTLHSLVPIALALVNLGVVAVALARHPAFFSEPGARLTAAGSVAAMAACAAAIGWAGNGRRRAALFEIAVIFGCIGAALEVLNIAIENSMGNRAAITLGFMLLVFLSWGAAGFRATTALGTLRSGVSAAVLSALICMLLAVTAGFLFELLLRPPDASSVATWAEFKRSGWTDVRAFAIANTLGAGFTHLVVAPFIAILFGCAGSLLGQVRQKPVSRNSGPLIP